MNITLENKIINGFILSLLILIFIAIVSFLCINDLADDARRTKQSQEVITQLSSLLSTITDAETAQRGYIITGNAAFLELYEQATPEISKLFRSLRELTADNQYHQKRLNTIESRIDKRLLMIKGNIKMRRIEGYEKVQREIASGKGRLLQNEIRSKIANMSHEEFIIQNSLEQNSSRNIRFAKQVIVFGSLLALLFVSLALIIISRGFTERRLAESEIQIKNEELQKINSQKDKFFSIIAHDLRSPFSGFLGLTEMMADELPGITSAEIQEIALSMQKSATNLYQLLENLLEWSLMEQGLIPFTQDVVHLKPIVVKSLNPLLESARYKGIEISYELPGELKAYADSNMLQTILRNLVSNAIKFTDKNGKICISAKAIAGKSIEIMIKDSGVGMKKEMIENLFKIDVKTGTPGTMGESSTGLGLLLCKEFVEKHGGNLRVKSEVNKGSEFYFTIPCYDEHENLTVL